MYFSNREYGDTFVHDKVNHANHIENIMY
jgi:hypothetical protein